MTSLIKRNKNLVSKISKDLQMILDDHLLRTHHTRLPDDGYRVYVYLESRLKYKIRAFEDGQYIYIGYDLGAPFTLTYDGGVYGNSLRNIIMRSAYKTASWSVVNDELAAAIGADLETVKADPSILDNIVDEIDKSIRNLIGSCDVEYTLSEGQFPKLVDRKLVPLVIIDTVEGTVDYNKGDRWAETYRKGRNKLSLSDFMSNGKHLRDASRLNSDYFVSVKITNTAGGHVD